jgi:hypothetical protein
MGLEVSPMCDRDTISLCNMQMGFIEFVVAPLIIGELGAAACDFGCVCEMFCTVWCCIALLWVCDPSALLTTVHLLLCANEVPVHLFCPVLTLCPVVPCLCYSVRQHPALAERDRRQHGRELQPVGPEASSRVGPEGGRQREARRGSQAGGASEEVGRPHGVRQHAEGHAAAQAHLLLEEVVRRPELV